MIAARGKLKIFFGYSAGAGKTYAMLKAAQEEKSAGVDVVIGYLEPHDRPETLKMAEGLEVLPLKKIQYRGITLNEFDVDAAERAARSCCLSTSWRIPTRPTAKTENAIWI